MPEEKNYKPSGKSLSRRDLLFLVLILMIGAGTIIYGFFSLSEGIKSPLMAQQSSFSTEQNDELTKIIELQSTDADKDGLTDYDELYVYKTSPYLEDSDGDGFSDKQEIETGNDPNCLPGQKCANTGEAESEKTDQEKLYELYGIESEAGQGSESGDMTGDAGITMTPEFLRQELLKGGISQEVLDRYSDEELMRIYSESIMGINTDELGTETAEPEAGADTANKVQETPAGNTSLPENLNAEEIRKLLIESGADEEVLSQFSDEDLIAIYKEIITQQ